MMNPIRVSPVPAPAPHSSSSGLRRSPTSYSLAHMLATAEQQRQPQDSDSESDGGASPSAAARARKCGGGSASLPLRKPPRHSSVPMCAQILLALWQRELQRTDVSITSDFFYDLGGSDEQAFYLVDRMQRMGFHISLQQFFALPRCSIYSVLLVAL